ncbi:MAG: hypothetical protein IPP30_11395 [Flavobacterium sp.]|nr:hypothetical protein [Flavobacterium sp.]
MKRLLFIFFIAIGLSTSCVKPPVEDPDPVPTPGNVTANFDDQVFSSITSEVVIDDISLSLDAAQEDGSFFRITLPEAPLIGTYTWSVYEASSPGFYLAYFENPDAVPFVAARDNIGDFANFPNYTDTAELVIYNIDKVNKRISGSFKFTGVRFTDDTQTDVETRVFTNGSFVSLPYTSAPIIDPNATVLVKKITFTDADNTVGSITYFYSGDKLNYLIDEDGNKTNFIYQGNLLIEEDTYFGTSSTLIEKTTYDYNNSSKLITYVNVDLLSDTGSRITYSHNSNGTIDYQEYIGSQDVQDELYSSGTLTSTSRIENSTNPITQEPQIFTGGFTYDNKNNPFKNVIGYDKIYFSDSDMALNYVNNVLERTDQIDSDPPYILETLTYTYNTANYPTKIVHRGQSGEIEYTEDIIYY